jgi:ABC-type nitrate/sulfonate/bicarbonate transport system substrate-binding protein
MKDGIAYGRFPPAASLLAAAPVLIGVADKTFERYDLEVQVVRPTPSTWMMLADGGIDVGGCHVAFAAQEPMAGKLKAVGVYERHRPGRGLTALLARPELIASGQLDDDPASIAGKRIGLLPGRPDDFLAWWGILRQAGLTMADVTVLPIPHGGDERTDALTRGEVDIVIGRAPRQRSEEIASGIVAQWKLGEEVAPGRQIQYLSANSTYLREHPDVVARFLAGWLDAVDIYQEAYAEGGDLDRVVELLAGQTGEAPELIRTMTPAGFDPDGRISPDQLQDDLDVLAQHDLVPTGTSVSDVADLEVMSMAHDVRGT